MNLQLFQEFQEGLKACEHPTYQPSVWGASKSWGAGRERHLFQLQIRVPPLEHRPEFLRQRFDPSVREQMCPACDPLHLLACAEALADHLIDRGFHKARADPFPMAVVRAAGMIV
jgi:hypothetical protein